MKRVLLASGIAVALMGAAATLPLFMARLENEGQAITGSVAAVAGGLIVGGLLLIAAGLRLRAAESTPSGLRIALAANMLFLAFCALELSDRLVRQEGRVFYWTTILFAPALISFAGLLAAQRWAWWIFRAAAALAVLWFVGFVVIIPFAPLATDGVPVPWQGRVYMTAVTLLFAAAFAAAYRSLGRTDVRTYFGLLRATR